MHTQIKKLIFITIVLIQSTCMYSYFFTNTSLKAPTPVRTNTLYPFHIAMGGSSNNPFCFFGCQYKTSSHRVTYANSINRTDYKTWNFTQNPGTQIGNYTDLSSNAPDECYVSASNPALGDPNLYGAAAYIAHTSTSNRPIYIALLNNTLAIGSNKAASSTTAKGNYPRIFMNTDFNGLACWQTNNDTAQACPCSIQGIYFYEKLGIWNYINLKTLSTDTYAGAPALWMNMNSFGAVAWGHEYKNEGGISFYNPTLNMNNGGWTTLTPISNCTQGQSVDVVISESKDEDFNSPTTAIVVYQDQNSSQLYAAYIILNPTSNTITQQIPIAVSNQPMSTLMANSLFPTTFTPLQITTTKNNQTTFKNQIAMAVWVQNMDGGGKTLATKLLYFDYATQNQINSPVTVLSDLGFKPIINTTYDVATNGTNAPNWHISMDGAGNATLVYRNTDNQVECAVYCQQNNQWLRSNSPISSTDSPGASMDSSEQYFAQQNNRRLSSMNLAGNAVICFTNIGNTGDPAVDTRFNWLGDITMANTVIIKNIIDSSVTIEDNPITPTQTCQVLNINNSVTKNINRFGTQGEYINIIQWNPFENATGYALYKNSDCNSISCTALPFATVDSKTTSFIDHNQSSNSKQSYCVVPMNNSGPYNCNLLTWTPVISPALTGYTIKRNSIIIAQVDANTSSYSDCTITQGVSYMYEIDPLPETVNEYNLITWDKQSTAIGYNIYRSQSPLTEAACPTPPDGCGVDDCLIYSTDDPNTTSYRDYNIDLTTCMYTYKVTAITASGNDNCIQLNWNPINTSDINSPYYFLGANVAVKYNIYKDGTLIGNVSIPVPPANINGQYVSYTDCPSDDDLHNYNIVAVDINGFETFPRTGVTASSEGS